MADPVMKGGAAWAGVACGLRIMGADTETLRLVRLGYEAGTLDAAARLSDIPLDDLRRAGMQDDASHEAMRALFIRALK